MFYNVPSDYLSRTSPKIEGTAEAEAIADAVNPEIDGLHVSIKNMANNRTVTHANAEGIARWEEILGIAPPQGASLEDRRVAARSVLMTKAPINIQRLKEIVSTYIDSPVEVRAADYILTIWHKDAKIGDGDGSLRDTVERLIPANLILRILYNYVRWGTVKPVTWGELRQKTWNQARLEE